MSQSLYDVDFVEWTRRQAEALRARGRGGNEVDWERVAEEIEEMGRSEVNAVHSILARIVEHLHKLRMTGRSEPRRHWRTEVQAWRVYLRRRMTPTIRAKMEAEIDAIHEQGALDAERMLLIEEPGLPPFDHTIRWTLAQLLGEKDDPLTGA